MGPVKTSIRRRYHFESAHHLPKVPENHRCHRIHGHNYEMEVEVTGPLMTGLYGGFVFDFWALDAVVNPLLATVDHRLLNDVEGLENPTAELIATWFLEKIDKALALPASQVTSVSIYETKDAIATVTRI